MMIRRLGPDGIASRMAELEAKMEAKIGPIEQKIENKLGSMPIMGPPSGLNGKIGSKAPLSPFGANMRMDALNAPTEFQPLISRSASEFGIEPELLDALIGVESSYNARSTSNKGARGLTQLMPDVAESLGVIDPYDPEQSIRGGAKYLATLLQKFKDPKLALAAYNAGPGAVLKAGGVPPFRETQNYVERVMSLYRMRKGGQ